MAAAKTSTFGELLRSWRLTRRASQLELGMEAGVSARHISFIETGRANPSQEMVIILATCSTSRYANATFYYTRQAMRRYIAKPDWMTHRWRRCAEPWS